jgi:hypothetical protein
MLFLHRTARRVNIAVVDRNVQGRLEGILVALKVFRRGLALTRGTLIELKTGLYFVFIAI